MPAWSDLVQVLFMVADDYFLIVSSHGREREANSLRTLSRALIPLLRTPPSNLITSHRLHFLISLHWGMGFQNMNFEKKNIQSIKTHPLEQQSLPQFSFHSIHYISFQFHQGLKGYLSPSFSANQPCPFSSLPKKYVVVPHHPPLFL